MPAKKKEVVESKAKTPKTTKKATTKIVATVVPTETVEVADITPEAVIVVEAAPKIIVLTEKGPVNFAELNAENAALILKFIAEAPTSSDAKNWAMACLGIDSPQIPTALLSLQEKGLLNEELNLTGFGRTTATSKINFDIKQQNRNINFGKLAKSSSKKYNTAAIKIIADVLRESIKAELENGTYKPDPHMEKGLFESFKSLVLTLDALGWTKEIDKFLKGE